MKYRLPPCLFTLFFSFAAGANLDLNSDSLEAGKPKTSLKISLGGISKLGAPPDLSGEWISPCENLGTDGLVFSRIVNLAYIGNYHVVIYSDFSGPDCISQKFMEKRAELWEYKITGKSAFLPGFYEVILRPAKLAASGSGEGGGDKSYRHYVRTDGRRGEQKWCYRLLPSSYRHYVRKDGRRLYVILDFPLESDLEFGNAAESPLVKLDYDFSRSLEESVEEYLAGAPIICY